MADAPDTPLEAARAGAARLEKLDAMLRHLAEERDALTEKIQVLSHACDKEFNEADRLDGGGLITAFHSLLNDLDARRKKERAEALAAQLKYNAALEELRAMKEQISRLKSERGKYVDCPAEYKRLSEQQRTVLLEAHGVSGGELADKHEKIARLKIRIKEVSEALEAGNLVLLRLSRAASSLSSRYWGRGMLTSVLADQINSSVVLSSMGSVQTLMREFNTQLADVKKLADIRHDSEKYSQFASVFYESIIKDYMTSDSLMHSYDHVMRLKAQVGSILQKLRLMKMEDTRRIKGLEQELGPESTDESPQAAQASKPGKEDLKAGIKEAADLIDTGCDILLSLERVLERIGSAEKLGWADVVDPTHVSGIVKHAQLNAARAEADRTYSLLMRFQNTLPVVLPALDQTFGFDSIDEFADIYLDGLSIDLAAQAKIMNAKARLVSLKEQVEGIIHQLSIKKEQDSEALTAMENGSSAPADLIGT